MLSALSVVSDRQIIIAYGAFFFLSNPDQMSKINIRKFRTIYQKALCWFLHILPPPLKSFEQSRTKYHNFNSKEHVKMSISLKILIKLSKKYFLRNQYFYIKWFFFIACSWKGLWFCHLKLQFILYNIGKYSVFWWSFSSCPTY